MSGKSKAATATAKARTLLTTIIEPPAGFAPQLPLWIRAPKKGPEHWTGFSRSKLYELAKDGKIRSVSIREPGQNKGTRLFELQSILEFIDSRAGRPKAA